MGSGIHVYSYCGRDVRCAIVRGCELHELCAGANFQPIPAGGLHVAFGSYLAGEGITIQCGIGSDIREVSQIEWTHEPSQGKVYFDLSNVKGDPFMPYGMTVYTSEGRSSQFPTCYGALCKPGDGQCAYVYNDDDDARAGERSCSSSVDVSWHLCMADTGISLPAPGTGL